jgi:hypothetical protein
MYKYNVIDTRDIREMSTSVYTIRSKWDAAARTASKRCDMQVIPKVLELRAYVPHS